MSTPLFISADHKGFALKEFIKQQLQRENVVVDDLSPELQENMDYPLQAARVAHAVREGRGDGIVICGSGNGVAMAANRFGGVRAAIARTPEEARLAREHNHANVLALGADFTSQSEAMTIVSAWRAAQPSTEARHLRRTQELDTLI